MVLQTVMNVAAVRFVIILIYLKLGRLFHLLSWKASHFAQPP